MKNPSFTCEAVTTWYLGYQKTWIMNYCSGGIIKFGWYVTPPHAAESIVPPVIFNVLNIFSNQGAIYLIRHHLESCAVLNLFGSRSSLRFKAICIHLTIYSLFRILTFFYKKSSIIKLPKTQHSQKHDIKICMWPYGRKDRQTHTPKQ